MFCQLFGYSKQAYYKNLTASRDRRDENLRIKQAVLEIRGQLPRLGTRKLKFILDRSDKVIGRDRLFDLLGEEGLLISKRRKYTITTNSKHWMRKYPDLRKELNVHRPEQLWVADITYLDILDTNGYLHLITDAYSKKVMGYQLCENMEAISTLKALKMALGRRQYPKAELMHHSDRGLQYCSKLYTEHLKNSGITISMTENGDPYENAVAERINGILKDEFGLGERMDDMHQANRLARQSIGAYNSLRPHLSCRFLTPEQMHNQQKIKMKTWKKKAPKTDQSLVLS
jgi:transposase InsO family protein